MFKRIAASLRAPDSGLRRFALFIVVGVLNTAFGYGCFVLLLALHLHYSLAALISTILGVLFNFRTIGRIVFRDGNNRLLLRFVCVYVAGYGFNVLGLKLLLAAGIGPYWGGALMLLPSAVLSFFLLRKFVYRQGGADANGAPSC